jgi:hypothetical protein
MKITQTVPTGVSLSRVVPNQNTAFALSPAIAPKRVPASDPGRRPESKQCRYLIMP